MSKNLVSVMVLAALAACDDGPSRTTVAHRGGTAGASPLPGVDEPVVAPPIAVGSALDPVTPPALTLESLCGPIAAATCRVHLGCRVGVTREALLGCEDHVRAACEDERPRLEARVAGERLHYDPAAWRECLARMDLLTCDAPEAMQATLGGACDRVLVGRLAVGASCADAGDCAPGLACVADGGACPGTCRALGALGDHCDAELAPCGDGLTCEPGRDGDGRCMKAQVALGEPCVTTTQCPALGYCEDLEVGAVCVPRVGRGQTCGDDDQCAAADYCKIITLGDELALETGTCAARIAEGGACDPLVGGCVGELVCDEASDTCQPVPVHAGESCVADVSPCGASSGLVCDAERCELEPFVGDACVPAGGSASSAGDRCRFGFCAADSDASGVGTCAAFLAPHAACTSDDECGALACVDGRCDRPAAMRCQASQRDINLGFRYRLR